METKMEMKREVEIEMICKKHEHELLGMRLLYSRF